MVARYAERSGRDVSAIDWYHVFARWKGAIVLEGSYAKWQRGESDKPVHEWFGPQADRLLESAGELIPVTVTGPGRFLVNPTFRCDGKVVVVTGGSKGLGRAMALGFAEAGADVVVASRKLDACEAVADEVRALGRRALAVSCHVGDWAQCEALVDATVAEFGRIDVLVNNAGIAPVPPSLAGVTEDLFDKTIDVNLKGPLRLSALAAPTTCRAGARIITISSKASLHPSPFTVVYAAAKSGLNTLTKAMSLEFAPQGIRVNGIICGMFHTDSFHSSVRRRSRRRGDGRRAPRSAGSPTPTRSSAPRSTSPPTRRRTSPGR